MKAWCLKSRGTLVAWTCFRLGPEYCVSAFYDIDGLDKAKQRMDEYVRKGEIEVVEVEITETGNRYDPDQPGLYKMKGNENV